MSASSGKPGRPPRSASPSDVRVELRTTAAERQAWEVKADRAGLNLSEWIRQRCNRTR